MAMVFPASPTVGQVFTEGGRSWVWSGSTWDAPSATNTLLAPYGLELVKTQTIGTAVTSVTVSDAFSAKYDDYLILISGGTAAGTSILGLRVGSQTTNYLQSYIYSNYNTSAAADAGSASTSIPYAGNVTATGINMKVEVQGPFLPNNTSFACGASALGSSFLGSSVAYLNNTTSYTSFTILSGVNMTGGLIKVYGYRKA